MNPYENCPIFENEIYLLRLLENADADDLLAVYSDQKAQRLFNADNCTGDFKIDSLECMQRMVSYWLRSYQIQDFIRWTIYDKTIQKAVGTIELFLRRANDYYNDCALLRLDLHSDYENEDVISKIILLILMPIFAMFPCKMIATKIIPEGRARKNAFEAMGFSASKETLIGGHSGVPYTDYFVLRKNQIHQNGIPKG